METPLPILQVAHRRSVAVRSKRPGGVRFRQARADDMLACARVFKRAAADLSRRTGGTPPQVKLREMAFALSHLQRTDPKGFHVAVKDGRVVCFASTILRDNVHFLSMFWGLPSLQSKGIGREVLRRAFEEPHPPERAVRCVYASLDSRAQALYLKFGMLPRGLIYMLRGPFSIGPAPKRRVELHPVGQPGRASREALAIAARYDRVFRASRRDEDIRFVMGLKRARFLEARSRGRAAGYVIVNEEGRIGPGGVLDPSLSAGLTWATLAAARELGAKNATAFLPGLNGGALDVFFRAGLRTQFPGAWMATKDIGRFDGYLMGGGMLL